MNILQCAKIRFDPILNKFELYWYFVMSNFNMNINRCYFSNNNFNSL